ncbi:hypothetical protein QTP86_028138 [Hemibagrus guttatus]|nr:hypothetical protein QTP86_028138 [Hemibagrus guttatus]
MTVMKGMMISRTVRRVSSPVLKTLEVMMRVVMTMKRQKKSIWQKRQMLMKTERV